MAIAHARQFAPTGVTKHGSIGHGFHRERSALWRLELRTARRRSVARRGRLCLGYAGPSLPRLPLRLFSCESGPLPSEDPGRDGGTGGPADADVARLSQRPVGPLL